MAGLSDYTPRQMRLMALGQGLAGFGAGLAGGNGWGEGLSRGIAGANAGLSQAQEDDLRRMMFAMQREQFDVSKGFQERQADLAEKSYGLNERKSNAEMAAAAATAKMQQQAMAALGLGDFGGAPPASSGLADYGQPSIAAEPLAPAAYEPTIAKAAAEFGVPEAGLRALLARESNFDPAAVSPAGAQGIAQFMPATAGEMGIDPRDPQESIYGAAKYLRQLNDQFGGDWMKTLAAYNAGPGRVQAGGALPQETQDYTAALSQHFDPQQPQVADAGGMSEQDAAYRNALWKTAGFEGAPYTAAKPPETHGNLEYVDGRWRPIAGYAAAGQQGFVVGEDGKPTVLLSRKGTSDVETRRINAGEQLARLRNIDTLFKPEYQEIGTRLKTSWSSLQAKMGGGLSKPDIAQLREFKQYSRRGLENLNATIKEITGAAMTEGEAERIKGQLPNPGTGVFDGDDPISFKAKLDDAVTTTTMAVARYNYMLTHGLDVSEGADDAANFKSLDAMPEFIEDVGATIEAKVRAENPDAGDDAVNAEVQTLLMQEFGL